MHVGVFVLETEESFFFHLLLFNASSKIILALHNTNEMQGTSHFGFWLLWVTYP
jgi:hypothetical protein